MVIAAPKDLFSKSELDALKNYIEGGGNVFVLMTEGGETKNNTNVNYLLEQYGINVNNDCVVRTAFYKYFHPKEALIQNGILSQEVVRVANGRPKEDKVKKPTTQFLSHVLHGKEDEEDETDERGLDFVYVSGATLNVQSPSVPILGSGSLCYPRSRPLGALYQGPKGRGKLAVLGSYDVFSDEYLEKEENSKLLDFFLKFFFGNEVELEAPKSEEQETQEYSHIPDISSLAEQLKSCLQESEDLPRDFTTLFDTSLFKYDTNLVPDAVKLYGQLSVKHEGLTLIPPQFETPMLGLSPAVFPPILKELPAPNLELFDLDEEFASEKVRLAQVTNKCSNDDLAYFVSECGDILGISDKIKSKSDPKAIISYVLSQLFEFKKLNQG
eukprot:CAMPEP_0176428450 /NCGR_PEP_ID=MMETSP0127-20121128/13158_1 /TAXON_ID=938130 /ORGANISM="Platyophrya macrostoma, Strain WH" /LENGTH=383 /DNA_ID=CAMNT_0017810137 /DNA_START=152 /DNA_END=1303 /DNA_ORIENTATION=-